MFGLCLVAALGATGIAARWLLAGSDGPFPAISVGSCAVLAVAASLPVVVRLNLDSRLSRDASALVGVHVRVDCQTLTGSSLDLGAELGFVRWGPDGLPELKTLIKHRQCNDLQSYLDSDKRHPSAAQVLAVHVLTHESMHMAGNTSESVAECYALQHDAQLARIMGASPADAHALAVRYWRTVYPHMPADYVSPGCGPGGSLDLHLPEAPWAPATVPAANV
jgi:hypothetical protein